MIHDLADTLFIALASAAAIGLLWLARRRARKPRKGVAGDVMHRRLWPPRET